MKDTEFSVVIRDGYALVTAGAKTGIAVPTITEQAILLDMRGWHDTYEDALAIVDAMTVAGLEPDDLVRHNMEGYESATTHEEDDDEDEQEGSRPALTVVPHGRVTDPDDTDGGPVPA